MIAASAIHKPNAIPVFHARGLSKVYQMGEVDVHALRDVDLDIFEGEFVALLGPSGSGKSTLLNILGGLDSPSSGEGASAGSSPQPSPRSRRSASKSKG